MSNYWLKTAKGQVLGPVSLTVLRDLAGARSRLDLIEVSRDGRTWVLPGELDELAEARVAPSLAEVLTREQQQARRIWTLLSEFQRQPTSAVFGVHADELKLKKYRRAFVSRAKPYHPAKLPDSVHPELLAACMAMFQFLSERMTQIERHFRTVARLPLDGTPVPLGPRFGVDDFVGLTRHSDNRLEARVLVTRENSTMFTEHSQVNLDAGGVFLRTEKALPLGTPLDLVFAFREPPRDIRSHGTVVWESSHDLPPAHHGFGVRLERLSKTDRAFLRSFVEQVERRRSW